MNRLCCQVHPFLVCGECEKLFCSTCWHGDSTHITKGISSDEVLHCPKSRQHIGTEGGVPYQYAQDAGEEISALRAEYKCEWALVRLDRK